MRRVVLAFSKDETAQKIRHMLDGSMYEVCMVCHSAAELIRSASELDDILVIMGYKLGSMMADEVVYSLDEVKVMAIVKAERQESVEAEDDLFVVPLPLSRERLITAIDIFLGYVQPIKQKKRTPDEEKTIEKAKLYLMDKYCMTENDAHRFIQKKSMDHGSKFIDTARLILRI